MKKRKRRGLLQVCIATTPDLHATSIDQLMWRFPFKPAKQHKLSWASTVVRQQILCDQPNPRERIKLIDDKTVRLDRPRSEPLIQMQWPAKGTTARTVLQMESISHINNDTLP